MKIISSIWYLTRQGLPIRGHTDVNSNIHHFLKLRSNNSPKINGWFSRITFK